MALREGVASPVTLSLDDPNSFEIEGSSWTFLCSISIRFKDGTSPLQYFLHILLYADSRATAKEGPLQTGDPAIRSRRLILSFERAVISEARSTDNCTHSSSFLATRCPKPESNKQLHKLNNVLSNNQFWQDLELTNFTEKTDTNIMSVY